MTDKHAKVNSCSYNSWNNQANRPIMPTSGYREAYYAYMNIQQCHAVIKRTLQQYTCHRDNFTSSLGRRRTTSLDHSRANTLFTHLRPSTFSSHLLESLYAAPVFFMSLDGVPVHCKGGVIWLHWLTGDWLLGSQPGPHAWYESSVNPHQPGNKQSQVNPSKHQTLSSVLRPHQHIGHMSPIRHQSLVTSPWPAKGPGIYAGLR